MVETSGLMDGGVNEWVTVDEVEVLMNTGVVVIEGGIVVGGYDDSWDYCEIVLDGGLL